MKNYPTLLMKICCLLCAAIPLRAAAEVSFVSATNALTLFTTVANDDGGNVFVFKGIADGETSDLTFSLNSPCPLIAMTGGAKLTGKFTCLDGTITATVQNKGGMSFGPATPDTQGSFYVAFGNPPSPGQGESLSALQGMQISIYGDVSKWNLSGEQTVSGVSFGVELTGEQGGEAHFNMQIPQAGVSFLGGVLGVTVGGKSDPFASVTTDNDGNATVAVDITSLEATSARSHKTSTVASTAITKKILAGGRTLGLAASQSSVKAGGSLVLALCTGKTFTAGEKVPVKFTVGGKATSAQKALSLTLDSRGCVKKTLKVAKSIKGILKAQVVHKGQKASVSIKVSK